MDAVLGIDLGGTNVKGLALSTSGELLADINEATGDKGGSEWRESVRTVVWQLEKCLGFKANGIGLATPGLPARDARSITHMQGRLAGLAGCVWQDYLDRPHPVPVLNDAQAALLGETWRGAAASARDLLLLTLGTGVGGAAMIDGHVLRGHLGRAGHFGHVSLDPLGTPDIVGTPGSLEDAIGECTLARRCQGRFRSTQELVAAYRANDTEAAKIWLRSLDALAGALVSFINILDPAVIVLGGGYDGGGRHSVCSAEGTTAAPRMAAGRASSESRAGAAGRPRRCIRRGMAGVAPRNSDPLLTSRDRLLAALFDTPLDFFLL
jgi:glucokinase